MKRNTTLVAAALLLGCSGTESSNGTTVTTPITSVSASERPPEPPPEPSAPGPSAAANECSPPFTLDPATGRRRYKRKCLRP